MDNKEVVPQPHSNTWKIALAFVCAAMLGYGLLCSINSTANLSYFIGYHFPLVLIVWVFYYIAVTRKRKLKIRGKSFLAIYISILTGSLIGLCWQKQQETLALKEIQNQYSALIELSTDPQGIPKRIEKQTDTAPKASGDYGGMERFVKEFTSQIVSQRNDYLLELESAGWNRILDANRIGNDKSFAESRDIIRKAREIVNKNQAKINALVSNSKERIRSLNISETAKRDMLLGFERGIDKTRNILDTLGSLEIKIVDEVENIINLLSDTKGDWIVENKRILFYDSNGLDKYNFYMASIQNIVNQQEEIQRQCIQKLKEQKQH